MGTPAFHVCANTQSRASEESVHQKHELGLYQLSKWLDDPEDSHCMWTSFRRDGHFDRIDYDITFDEQGNVTYFHYLQYEHKKLK